MPKSKEEMLAENIAKAVNDGPAIRNSYNTWIAAKDSKAKRVLLGGLGCMGVGEMWFSDQSCYADYPGYADAPERESFDPSKPLDFGPLIENMAKELSVLKKHNEGNS
jgi:hypothetical protein